MWRRGRRRISTVEAGGEGGGVEINKFGNK